MRKFLFIFILPFLHGYCGLANAQTYVEKQAGSFNNLLDNPGFENGLARWTKASECQLGSLPLPGGVRSITCTGVSSAKTLWEQSKSISEYRPLIGMPFRSSCYLTANSDAVEICALKDGSEVDCLKVLASDSLNAAGLKEYAVSFKIPDSQNGAFTVGTRVKTTNSTVTAVNGDLCEVGPFKGVVGLNPNATELVSAGAITIGAVTSAPGKGGTPSPDVVRWGRRGDLGIFRYEFKQTVAGSAGSGHYLFSLPNGLRFDSNKISFYTGGTGTVGPQAAGSGVAIGGASGTSNTAALTGEVIPYDATRFRIYFSQAASNAGYFGSGFAPLSVAATSFTADFIAPIEGWGVATVTDVVGLVPSETEYTATVDNSGVSPIIVRETPEFLVSVSRPATGRVLWTYKTGFWNGNVPDCSFTSNGSAPFINSANAASIDTAVTANSSINTIKCRRTGADYNRARSTYENVPMGVVKSGTYTPTTSSLSNVLTFTDANWRWVQIGDIVTVTGSFQMSHTSSAANFGLDVSLPVPRVSDFSNITQCGGPLSAFQTTGYVIAQTSTKLCHIGGYVAAGRSSSSVYGISFSYSVK